MSYLSCAKASLIPRVLVTLEWKAGRCSSFPEHALHDGEKPRRMRLELERDDDPDDDDPDLDDPESESDVEEESESDDEEDDDFDDL